MLLPLLQNICITRYAQNVDLLNPDASTDVIKLKPDVLSEVLAEVGGLPKNLIGKRLFVDFDRKMRPATVDFWPDKEK